LLPVLLAHGRPSPLAPVLGRASVSAAGPATWSPPPDGYRPVGAILRWRLRSSLTRV
jgi:hypothetical protein